MLLHQTVNKEACHNLAKFRGFMVKPVGIAAYSNVYARGTLAINAERLCVARFAVPAS